jgi:hypothetical protein
MAACSEKSTEPQRDSVDDSMQQAMDEAAQKTSEFVEVAVRSYMTGETSELKAYLADRDEENVIGDLLIKQGIDLDRNVPRMAIPSVDLPDFALHEGFEDGSVLLSRHTGHPTSDLLAWIIPGLYTHTGVLDQELYTGPDAGCVITANLDGVTYETYNDWAGATTVTKLNVDGDAVTWPHPQFNAAQQWLMSTYQGSTLYAFLRLNLEPITRENQLFWYCSKTNWRVFDLVGIDVENANWYDGKLDQLRQSGLYQLYRAFLALFLPDAWAARLADAKLVRVVTELITPDEVRFATSDNPDGSEGGALDPSSRETWGVPEPTL